MARQDTLAAVDLGSAPRQLYDLAVGLADRSLYPESIYAGLRLAARSPAGSVEDAPPCVQRLAYPLAYARTTQEQASQRGLDPFVVLSLLKQESWFGPHALSSADARGMSQVLPSTGSGIARSLGRAKFDAEDLYRPRESIAFGAWYLAEQMRNLGGRPR